MHAALATPLSLLSLLAAVSLPCPAAAAPPQPAQASTAAPVDAHGPIPFEGVGLIVGGAIATAGGIGLVAAGYVGCSSSELGCDEHERRKWAYAGFGIAAAGIGLATVGGIVKHRFDGWRDQRRLHVPKRGNGLFVGGGTLLAFGALAWGFTGHGSPRAAILGTVWTLGGAGLLAGGAVMRVRYRRWKHEAGFAYAMAPMMLPRGGGIAVRARF
jgi:hypothetical protein